MMYVLAYVPSLLIPYYVLGTGFHGVFPLTLAIVLSFGLLSLMQKLRIGVLGSPITTMRSYENIVFGTTVLLGAYIILALGLRTELPNLADVYDVRATYDSAVANSGAPFIAYVVDWSLYVANPLAMLLGLRTRRYGMCAAALVLQILGYGTTGYKEALFVVAVAIPLYVLLVGRRRAAVGLGIVLTPVAMIGFAFIWDQLTGSGLATSLFVRRSFAVPGQLVGYYYDFFSQNPTYALSDSILRFLGPAPYDLPPAYLIGAVYFQTSAMSANANLWADGFANFGFAGIFAATVLFGLLLVMLDGAAVGRDLRVAGSVAALMALPLSNSGLLTTILSHGLGFACLLIFLMPRTNGPDRGPPLTRRAEEDDRALENDLPEVVDGGRLLARTDVRR
jgi:hypothetical protein